MRQFLLLCTLGLLQPYVAGVVVSACENEFLDISCPEGHLIKIRAANYGRTSLNICFREPSVSTSCYAKNSLEIVRQACHNTRQCVFFTSNYMFGEPCSGTWKYVEVDYECRPDDKIRENQRRALICEANFLNLTCPAGQVIHVHDASYGRKNRIVCPRDPMKNVPCHSSRSLFAVRKSCEGFNSCYFHVLNTVFVDPCEETWKYLEVAWDCVEGDKDYGRTLVCEGNDLNIQCPPRKKIAVVAASYGRQDRQVCSRSPMTLDDCSADRLDIVKARCEASDKCIFLAGNAMFGDPCTGTWKYLTVDYKCLSNRKFIGPQSEDRVLLCYYNENLGYIKDVVPPEMCTHLVYMIATRDVNDGLLLSRKSSPQGILPRLTRLKRINPSLITLLGLEPHVLTKDYNLDDDNLLKTLNAYGFDGVEVLWWPKPFPIVGNKLKNLKTQLFNTDRILSLALVEERKELPKVLDLENYASYADLFTLAPFDTTNSYSDAKSAIEYVIKRRNIPKNKLLLGLPFFGWEVVEYVDGEGVEKTRNDRINYRELCMWFQDEKSGWEEHWDSRTFTPYAVNQANGHTLNFQNERSLKKKINIVIDMGIRGATIFDIQVDDHQGLCGKEYPLSYTVKDYMNINILPFYYETFVQNQELDDI